MEIIEVGAEDPRWSRALEDMAHDIYHRPEYATTTAGPDGGTATAIIARRGEDCLLTPLIRREFQQGKIHAIDATSPYGYSSPIATAHSGDASIHSMWSATLDYLAEAGYVTAFLRGHPVLNAHFSGFDGGLVACHGQTVVMHLDKNKPEDLRAKYSKNTRRDVRRMERDGLVAMPGWHYFSVFIKLYMANMRRLSAADYYLFDKSYFENIRTRLANWFDLITVLDAEERPVAAALFSLVGTGAQYHLAGSEKDAHRDGPLKLAIDKAAEWASTQGATTLHLGGGVGGRKDGLFRFKAGFSDARLDFCTLRTVLNPSLYEELAPAAGPPSADRPFPAYRFL